MPGKKYRSIKNPKVYEALRQQGMSKQSAARISNAQAHKDAGATAGAMVHGPGGLLSNTTPGRKWSNRRKLKDCTCGVATKEQIAPGVTRIRGNLCNVHGRYGPCDGGASKRTAKPKQRRARKPAKTLQQRQTERAAQQAANSKQVYSDIGLSADDTSALEALRSGGQANGEALAKKGLAERAEDGSYRLTASGRALVNAAKAGDSGRARDIMSAAADRKGAADQRRQAAADRKNQSEVDKWKRQSAREQRAAETKKRREDAAKRREQATKRGSGGSRSSSQSSVGTSREADRRQRQTERAADRAQRQSERAADRAQRQREHEEDRARRLSERDADRASRQSTSRDRVSNSRPGVIRPRRKPGPRSKSFDAFAVYKSANGDLRWIARSTTAYRDRDGEIITTKALETDAERMTATGQYGPLRYWHLGSPNPFDPVAPWGNGVDIGDCDYSTVIGRTSIESGTFRDPSVAQAVAQNAAEYELSPGFFHPIDQPNAAGEYEAIRRFERSIVPIQYGRASNLFTGMAVKDFRMDQATYEARVKAFMADMQSKGVPPETAAATLAGMEQADKSATDQGVAYKSAQDTQSADPWLAVMAALKAAVTPQQPAEESVAEKADMPAVEMVDAGDTELDDGLEEEMSEDAGDYLGDMTPAEFFAQLDQHLAPILKMQDMHKSLTDAIGEMKGMMGGYATKDDSRAQEIATLKARLAKLEGDQPAVVSNADIEAALKSGPVETHDPNTPIETDPDRPLQSVAAKLFAPLYQTDQSGQWTGWKNPTQS